MCARQAPPNSNANWTSRGPHGCGTDRSKNKMLDETSMSPTTNILVQFCGLDGGRFVVNQPVFAVSLHKRAQGISQSGPIAAEPKPLGHYGCLLLPLRTKPKRPTNHVPNRNDLRNPTKESRQAMMRKPMLPILSIKRRSGVLPVS